MYENETKKIELSKEPFSLAAGRVIEDYTKVSINELADGYCDATDLGDSELRDGYISAIILRFWSKIFKLTSLHPKLFPRYSDAYEAISSSILLACEPERRDWRKPEKHCNAESTINTILNTRYIANAYYDLSLKKNGGTGAGESAAFNENLSLEDVVFGNGSDDKDAKKLESFIAYDEGDYDTIDVFSVVQSCLDAGKIVEAIIVDNILTKDVFKTDVKCITDGSKHYKKNYTTFSPCKLVTEISALDNKYINSFLKKYKVSEKIFRATFNYVLSTSPHRKSVMINRCLKNFRNSIEDIYLI